MELLAKKTDHERPISPDVLACVGREAPQRVLQLLSLCPRYKPTPMHDLAGLARRLGVGQIFFKDEGQRLGLSSFKALGGVYAILEIVAERAAAALNRPVSPAELLTPPVLAVARGTTFVCASDGNHGRSVAAGARLVGAACVVYLHEGVSAARAGAIEALGARVERTRGTYDHSVEEALRVSRTNGWILVADTAEDEQDKVPALIMRGYTVIADEALAQLKVLESNPTHVFVQAGVGGLAAAMAGHLTERLGAAAPKIIVVEPDAADCLLQTRRAGALTTIAHNRSTIYAMLECLRPSPLAWEILRSRADFFLSVADDFAAEAMRALAYPRDGDTSTICGESGTAGLAGLMAVTANIEWRKMLALDETSRVLLIGTEGATDPESYRTLVTNR